MMELEYPRSSLRSHSQGKTSFQKELDSKMKDRKSRGLVIEDSDDESDDDGLGSDDDMLAQFNATSRFANRPGSAKHRGSPTAGMRDSPGLGLRGSPGPSQTEPSPRLAPVSPRYGKMTGMTAEEILKQRQQATPPPKPQPRKGASPVQPDRPLTKEEIIFGGRRTDKDASELPFREEKKTWQPPSFLRNSPLTTDELKASPRLANLDDKSRKKDLAELRSPRISDSTSRDDIRSRDGGRSRDDMRSRDGSRSRDDDSDLVIGRDSPDNRVSPSDPRSRYTRDSLSRDDLQPRESQPRESQSRESQSRESLSRESMSDGRKSPFEKERKRGLRKQESIHETPEPKSRFIKPKERDQPKPEPRSRASSTSSEVFKKSGRSTPKYMIDETDSEDSADEFLRKVKEHKVTTGRVTPDGRKTPSMDGGRGTPTHEGRTTPKDERKSSSPSSDRRKSSTSEGRKSPSSSGGRRSPLDKNKRSPEKEKKKEEEEPKRKSVYDLLVGDEEDSKKKEKKRGDNTPSPAPRRRLPSSPSTDRGRSPSPVKFEKPRSSRSREDDRHVSRLRDDDVTERVRRSRKPPGVELESSVCDDVEEDPFKNKIQSSYVTESSGKRKGSGKQTSVRQRADDVIGQVADLNEKEARTMQYIQAEEEGKKETKKAPVKTDGKLVRPQPRYAVPRVSESRPESAKSYNSTSEIRDSIYQDWYKERMRKAKEEARLRKKREKEEQDKKNKEKMDKMTENKLAYDAWNKGKGNWVKDKVKEKKELEEKELNKVKENNEKLKDADMAFKTWKENKDVKNHDQVRKKKKEVMEKEETEEEKKKRRQSESEDFFKSWKKKKDEKLINTHKEKKLSEKEQKQKEEEEARRKEEEAKLSYERWLENSERKQRRMSLRMSQSTEELNNRPPWSPAKVIIGPKNCRIK